VSRRAAVRGPPAAPVGAIGVTEKGVTSVELRVEGRGGRASTPARRVPLLTTAAAQAVRAGIGTAAERLQAALTAAPALPRRHRSPLRPR